MKKMISRRNFLKVAGASTAALGLAACGAFVQLHRFLHCQLCCPVPRPLQRLTARSTT